MQPIDIAELISLTDVPRHMPSLPGGRRLTTSAIYHWVHRGLRGIKLQVVQIGGRRFTTVAAVQAFLRQVAAERGFTAVLPAVGDSAAPAVSV